MKLFVRCLNGYRVMLRKFASLRLMVGSMSKSLIPFAVRSNEHLRFNAYLTHTHIKIFGASVSHSPRLNVVYSDSLSLRCSAVCTISQGKAYVLGVDEGIFAVLEGMFGLENIIYE